MFILTNMVKDKAIKLRRGWTTGACATAAVKAALIGLWSKDFPKSIEIFLPNGESPSFPLLNPKSVFNWRLIFIYPLLYCHLYIPFYYWVPYLLLYWIKFCFSILFI